MSLLFRDRLYVALSGERIALARVGRRRGAGIVASHVEPVARHDLEGVRDVLGPLLSEPRWSQSSVHVLLSNTLVRYAFLPSSDAIVSAQDEHALAAHKIRQTHGGAAADWEIRLGNSLLDGDQPAAAFDAGFIAALKEQLRSAKLSLGSIEPFFMHAYNQSRARLPGGGFWFVNAEPGAMVLARIEAGRWRSFTACRAGSDPGAQLGSRLREAALLADAPLEAASIYVHAPAIAGDALRIGGHDMVNLCNSADAGRNAVAHACALHLGV